MTSREEQARRRSTPYLLAPRRCEVAIARCARTHARREPGWVGPFCIYFPCCYAFDGLGRTNHRFLTNFGSSRRGTAAAAIREEAECTRRLSRSQGTDSDSTRATGLDWPSVDSIDPGARRFPCEATRCLFGGVGKPGGKPDMALVFSGEKFAGRVASHAASGCPTAMRLFGHGKETRAHRGSMPVGAYHLRCKRTGGWASPRWTLN
jgi:hypothetical protein